MLRKDMAINRRSVLAGLPLGLLSLSTGGGHALGSDEKAGGGPFDDIHALNISEPMVGITGPFPHLLRRAKIGELLVCEISYATIQNTPQSATVALSSQSLSLVGVYRAGNKVVVLTFQPQQGSVGLGVLLVVLKAMNAGRCNVVAKIKMADGTVNQVPFDFDVAVS